MKEILLTGATGFLGKFVLKELKKQSYQVTTLGRRKVEGTDFIQTDLTDVPKLKENSYSEIIHLAGKAHSIPKTDDEVKEFYQVNLVGTQNIIKALEHQKETLKTFIFASTIAVYGVDSGTDILEDDDLNPTTPYAISKFQAEEEIKKWCTDNNTKYFILRLPLIVGENPPGNLKSMINAIKRGWYIKMKNNSAKKSMVLAEDIAVLIPSLKQYNAGIYNLSDGYHPSFAEIEEAIEDNLQKKIRIVIPNTFLRVAAYGGDFLEKMGIGFPLTSLRLKKIKSTLTISDQNARQHLNWSPHSVIKKIKHFRL